MIDLDNIEEIKKLDKQGVYDSVVDFPKQCLDAWKANESLSVPESYKDIDKIIMTGMGGSGLGARVIESVFANELKYPLVRVNNYNLPDWTDEKTLVFCSSFSGTTEEAIENARQAKEKGSKWMAIGTGGTLIDQAKENGVPYYQINPIYNRSKQPRMAVGYSIIGQLAMAAKAGIVDINKEDVEEVAKATSEMQAGLNVEVLFDQNEAKQLAQKLHGKQVMFAAAEHLLASAHVAKNQMNENAKNFSAMFDVPEMNHHAMEGVRFPLQNKDNVVFLFIDSDLYSERIRQRMEVSKDVIAKNEITPLAWEAKFGTKFTQAFEAIQFFAFVNFYLAMLNGIDPAPIPWVDYFKEKLGQPLGQWK